MNNSDTHELFILSGLQSFKSVPSTGVPSCWKRRAAMRALSCVVLPC